MKTKHDISSGTCEDKTTTIFIYFFFVLCSALGLCLDHDLMHMITTILMSHAWLHAFICFAFCFVLMLMLMCEPGFAASKPIKSNFLDRAHLNYSVIYINRCTEIYTVIIVDSVKHKFSTI